LEVKIMAKNHERIIEKYVNLSIILFVLTSSFYGIKASYEHLTGQKQEAAKTVEEFRDTLAFLPNKVKEMSGEKHFSYEAVYTALERLIQDNATK